MIEVFKILQGIYDKDITDGILHLAQNDRIRGHSLKLTAQSSRLEQFLSQGCKIMECNCRNQSCPRKV